MYIKACSQDRPNSSLLSPPSAPYCLFLVGVSKRCLCVSRPYPARLLPIDSRWDLSIKYPELCSVPNPMAIQTHPSHTHTHFTCHPSISPSGPLLIPSILHFTLSSTTSGPRICSRSLISDGFTIKLKLLFNSFGLCVLVDLAAGARMSYSWHGGSAGAGIRGTRFITQPPNV